MNSEVVDYSLENGFYLCKYDRCGRKFDSENRLRDHQARMHDKVVLQTQQTSVINSGLQKKDESLKLPTISGQGIVSSKSSKISEKSDQLHPVIRQAQQITNNNINAISNNSGSYSHTKNQSLTTSVVKNNSIVGSGSRPSSSSSIFNTTSSTIFNVDHGIKDNHLLKNSFIENSQLKESHPNNQQSLDHSQRQDISQLALKQQISFEKQSSGRLTPNVMRRNNSQNQITNTTKPSSAQTNKEHNLQLKAENEYQQDRDKTKIEEEKVKTKEEILFGKKNFDRKQLPIQKFEKALDIQRKSTKQTQKTKQGGIEKNIDIDRDDEEDEIDNEMNREDQILNMRFSDEEDDEEEIDILNDDEQDNLNQTKQDKEQLKSRPSPSKEFKHKGFQNNEGNVKGENTSKQEKRRISFANKDQDLEKVNEDLELRKLCEIETKNVLTSKFILQYTGCSNLEEVEQVILRKKNLLYLKDTDELDWSELMNVQFLCVTHNQLLQDIEAIGSIPNHHLLDLNLEYNSICDISPILHHKQLEKLYLNGNKIQSIKGLHVLTQLKTLTLMKNSIKGFDSTLETLCHLSKLEELELEQNPVSSRFNYKYDILWKLKLKKLDGEEVTELDIDLSRTFQREYHNLLKETKRPDQPMRPGTAKDWGSNSTFHDNQSKSYKDRFKQKLNDLVQESKEVLNSIPEDKVSELETEIELARQQEEQLEAELEQLYIEQKEMREKKEKIIKQNDEFSTSLQEYQQMQQQKVQLTNKYKSYVDQLKNNDSEAANQIKQIYRMNLKLEELQQQNQELVIENNILSQTQSKFFNPSQPKPEETHKVNQQLRQSKVDFKKSLTLFNQIETQIKQAQSNKYQSNLYDDAEEVLSQDEEEEIPKQKQSKSSNKDVTSQKPQGDIKQKPSQQLQVENKSQEEFKKNKKEIEEDNEEDENDYTDQGLDLDIGFDSDDLDEEMKEIRDLLKKNDAALKDVKNDLDDI